MKTVKQVRDLTGVSCRTLHYYDSIGLLKPSAVTPAGYRLYDDAALNRLSRILLLRELGFPLKQIGSLLDAPDAERNRALQARIDAMRQKREALDNRIGLASAIKLTGVKHMNFEEFDYRKIDDWSAQAKTLWGKTDAWQEYSQKRDGRSPETDRALGDGLMAMFSQVAELRQLQPGSPQVQAWVDTLRAYITEHYYTCTVPILRGLGQMYAGGGSMTENIDAVGGPGTGEFACRAIEIYCDLA